MDFRDNGVIIGTGTLNGSGVATLTTATLLVASHPITAVYLGDGASQTSASGTVNQTVAQDSTTTTVSSSHTPSVFGEPAILTATVQANAPGAGIPTGTVTFKDNGVTIGSPVTLVNGQATLSTAASGRHPPDHRGVLG